MRILDKYRLETHGANGCSNSDYLLCRTTCCGGHCAEDVELHTLYPDPRDLTRRMDVWDPQTSCPLCGVNEWDLIEVTAEADVPEPWRWACGPADGEVTS